ncbi:MAG: hypothetical protein K2Y22_16400 [Candidatus Obscuribacterales bacterium]|nr:hypothetical protein [Candidatus Obscuribacterales bacterium]
MNQDLAKSKIAVDGSVGSNVLEVTITSFGYKQGPPPPAHMVFDVRFLQNPYWEETLRPLTGLDKPVSDYVLRQALAQDFLNTLSSMLCTILPRFADGKWREFTVAIGCTGGQHRSTTIVEALAARLKDALPQYKVAKQHRELNIGFAESCVTDEGLTGQEAMRPNREERS